MKISYKDAQALVERAYRPWGLAKNSKSKIRQIFVSAPVLPLGFPDEPAAKAPSTRKRTSRSPK